MSSIIDALKKSDHNRNSESSAKLNAIKFGQNPPQKTKRGFWLLVLLLLLLAAGVYAWTQGWHNDLIQYSKTWSTQTTENTEKKEQITSSTPDGEANNANQFTEKDAVKNQLTPPKQSDIKAKSAQLKKRQDASAASVDKGTAEFSSPNNDEIVPIVRVNEDHKIQANSDSETTASQPDMNAAETESRIASQDKPTTKEKPVKDSQSIQPKRQQDYLFLHQIDFAIRKNIPSVKVNIHIYDPLPENRMVLINGERFNIGDTIDDLVTIEDIVQEGVVVKFENVTFLIPK